MVSTKSAGGLPADAALTEHGLLPRGQGRILIIACGALAREILAVVRTNGLEHIDLACLPAILHNTPNAIPEAVESAVLLHRDAYDKIFVGYGDCGTGGRLSSLCQKLGVEMMAGPHCYSFFEGNETFQLRSETEFRAFYLTDFLVRQFEAFVIHPLGLDRHPDLRDQYFGNYESLVYLAQTEDPDLDARARRHAERLGLAYERRLTGYGDLGAAIASL